MARIKHKYFNPHHITANRKYGKTSSSTPGKQKGGNCVKDATKMWLISARSYKHPDYNEIYKTVFKIK